MKSPKREAASLADYQELFKTDIGQKVLFDLMRSHGVLNSCHVPGDPYSTAFNEGARSVVLRIAKRTKVNIEKFLKSIEQMNNDEGEF